MVYCSDGRARSVAIVVAYMMSSRKWGMQRCYETIKARHPFMWPGPPAALIEQLSEFEVTLFPAAVECDASESTVRCACAWLACGVVAVFVWV